VRPYSEGWRTLLPRRKLKKVRPPSSQKAVVRKVRSRRGPRDHGLRLTLSWSQQVFGCAGVSGRCETLFLYAAAQVVDLADEDPYDPAAQSGRRKTRCGIFCTEMDISWRTCMPSLSIDDGHQLRESDLCVDNGEARSHRNRCEVEGPAGPEGVRLLMRVGSLRARLSGGLRETREAVQAERIGAATTLMTTNRW